MSFHVQGRDASPDHSRVVDEHDLFARIDRRILPLPFLLGTISIIDRVNIGFVKDSLSADLGLTATAFGFGAGILFLGYFLLEVPSNAALKRFGARIWLCRIAITWGLICSLTAFVSTPWMFYTARFLLGAAEAGLFPGVVLYLTLWYPGRRRGRATGIFMASIPAATILGGPLAGWILGLHGTAGLQGWQWLFLIDGIPAILLGIALPFLLTDGPSSARWLREGEARWLTEQLETEATSSAAGRVRGSIAAVLRSPLVWLFTLVYFCYAIGSYGMAFFLPGILQQLGASTPMRVGLLTALPYAIGAIAMVLVARHSDRTGERRWHLAIPFMLGAAALIGTGLALGRPVLAYGFIILVGTALMATVGNFWARPTHVLAGTAAASGIAVINSFGNIGGFAGPYMFGWLMDATGGGSLAGLLFLAGALLLGGLVTIAVRNGARDTVEE